MNYILQITKRCNNSEGKTVRSWAFKTYCEASKKMIEELEALNRQIMATEQTGVTGYTILLNYWVEANKYKKVAVIEYDMAL